MLAQFCAYTSNCYWHAVWRSSTDQHRSWSRSHRSLIHAAARDVYSRVWSKKRVHNSTFLNF